MTKKKDSTITSLADEAKLELLLYLACRRGGWLFATTESDVAREEERQAADPIDIPVVLRDPNEVWKRAQQFISARKLAPKIDQETKANLARAARGGSPIPQEIQERMRRDRERAEKESRR